jgi:hypothetical protein
LVKAFSLGHPGSEHDMRRLQKKAQARTKQMVGQMIGDDLLVKEGEEEARRAESEDAGEPPPTEEKRDK